MEAVAGRPLDNRSTQWLKIPLKVSFLQHCELKSLLISASCMDLRRKIFQIENSIQHFELSRNFLTLVGLPFCPPGRSCSSVSAEKSAGKFKILYRFLARKFK